MKKYHYFSFSFICDNNAGGETYASVYTGYPDKCITKPRIGQAKKDAKVKENAVLLSCCYLGKMTRDKMINSDNGHNQSLQPTR